MKESRYAAAHIPRRLSCGPSPALRTGRGALLHIRGRALLRALAHDGLSRHAACYPHADPKHPSNRLRSHFDMMVAAADISPPPCIQRKMPVAGVPLAK